jgi:hypothetical protein
MRKDMAQVVVDEPRSGGRIKTPKGSRRKHQRGFDENSPSYEGIKAPHKQGYNSDTLKEFGEHLSPLYRFVEKAVGRPWDKVYSEVCENLSKDSVVQSHVIDHLMGWVELNCYVEDGKIYDSRGQKVYSEFYVANDGILQKNPHERRRMKYRPVKQERTDYCDLDGKHYHQINDIWYEIELTPIPKTDPPYFLYDVVLGELMRSNSSTRWQLRETYQQANVYGKSKKQINSRMIAKINKAIAERNKKSA